MLVPLPTKRMVAQVPSKSYTKKVPGVDTIMDENVYTGIFGNSPWGNG
jgi:hypothetical protein